ncbi:ribonuclease III, partial [Candidatus Saccharibacteria bacterium]|nr:ribonuclease III [Candidatus Saccharibacteria bacterium]NCU41088.1 ribonuclease III [Candidatus Saccharibacteria bacterium]
HKKSTTEHNERLEFLGDAVLELVVTHYLYVNFTDPEGILTSWRSALVRTESISEAGKRLGYEPLIRMSKGERQGSDRARAQILANAFEAVTGSIYLDQGYEIAEKFITKHILGKLEGIIDEGSWRDPKSHLQEVSQSVDSQTPSYRVLEEIGPDHEKIFRLGVYVGDKLMGLGEGPSKQIAQQQAAREALKTYKNRQTSE